MSDVLQVQVPTRALTLALVLATAGCAVDASGLGGARQDAGREGDAGTVVERDARPVDSSVPPVDSFVPPADSGPEVDSFVPPPDMCVATAEVCNGVDDDCNGSIDDGLSSAPCDGDGDGCMDGLGGCASGAPTCTGDAAPRAGDACDGPDADTSADGTLRCMSDALVCDGDCTPAAETCDRTDEDCNGVIDDGGACDSTEVTCTSRQNAGRVYQFCTVVGGGYTNDEARSYCDDLGYDLVRIGDMAEHSFLQMHIGGMSWWTRAHIHSNDGEERRDKSEWHWAGGDNLDYDPWGSGEPSGNGSCGQIRTSDGRLDDRDCDDRLAFICEGPIAS